VVLLDGAMGTMIQQHQLTEADFRGDLFIGHPKALKGNNDLLCLTQPDLIRQIHLDYLKAGSDIVSTNTFSANRISQNDYGLGDYVAKINHAAVALARAACHEVMKEDPSRRCFVAGSIGPTNVTLSISPDVSNAAMRSHNFEQLQAVYAEQIEAMIAAGVDILLAETSFDTLNLKACIAAIQAIEAQHGMRYPLILSATITDLSGRTLSGQTIEAFWHSVAYAQPLAVGLNCALGARDMLAAMQDLAKTATCYISCYPNAGLPNPLSETGYDESPAQTAHDLKAIVMQSGINIVGGCCGTTPDHIRAIKAAFADVTPHTPNSAPAATCLAGLEPLLIKASDQAQLYMVGERTNVTGSPLFAKLIQADDFVGALAVARSQVESGAHIIDIN
jgi:5-methyltetrahydrofolate--homocysteine methyltransferase